MSALEAAVQPVHDPAHPREQITCVPALPPLQRVTGLRSKAGYPAAATTSRDAGESVCCGWHVTKQVLPPVNKQKMKIFY